MARILPLVLFVAIAAVLVVGLDPERDPRRVPSPLIDKPTPAFSVTTLKDPNRQLDDKALLGKVTLINFWATWCAGCIQEHPLLVLAAREHGVNIMGMNHKDEMQSVGLNSESFSCNSFSSLLLLNILE